MNLDRKIPKTPKARLLRFLTTPITEIYNSATPTIKNTGMSDCLSLNQLEFRPNKKNHPNRFPIIKAVIAPFLLIFIQINGIIIADLYFVVVINFQIVYVGCAWDKVRFPMLDPS